MKHRVSQLNDNFEDMQTEKNHRLFGMIEEVLDYFGSFAWNDEVAMACCGAFTFDPD